MHRENRHVKFTTLTNFSTKKDGLTCLMTILSHHHSHYKDTRTFSFNCFFTNYFTVNTSSKHSIFFFFGQPHHGLKNVSSATWDWTHALMHWEHYVNHRITREFPTIFHFLTVNCKWNWWPTWGVNHRQGYTSLAACAKGRPCLTPPSQCGCSHSRASAPHCPCSRTFNFALRGILLTRLWSCWAAASPACLATTLPNLHFYTCPPPESSAPHFPIQSVEAQSWRSPEQRPQPLTHAVKLVLRTFRDSNGHTAFLETSKP